MMDFKDALLASALPVVRDYTIGIIESEYVMNGDVVVITDEDDRNEITELLALTRDIESAIGKKFIGPKWFDDMVFYGIDGEPK